MTWRRPRQLAVIEPQYLPFQVS